MPRSLFNACDKLISKKYNDTNAKIYELCMMLADEYRQSLSAEISYARSYRGSVVGYVCQQLRGLGDCPAIGSRMEHDGGNGLQLPPCGKGPIERLPKATRVAARFRLFSRSR
jgi:hypothetical protein